MPGGETVQALIELAYAYAKTRGFYENRGDPADWDKGIGDFVTDNTWRDLDLSALVPEYANAVHIRLAFENDFVMKTIAFREKGNVNVVNASETNSLVSAATHQRSVICALDSDRFILYRISVGGWTKLNFLVRGWWY